MNKSLVTVIIPIYNGRKYMKQTLDSLIAQTFENFEVFCVDDSSTDNSLEILRGYEKKDSRFRILTKQNGGSAVKTLVYALPYVQSEYIFYSSQDDLFSNDLLENMYNRAIETDADAVIPNMLFYYDNDSILAKGVYPPENKYDLVLTGKKACELSVDKTIHGFSLRRTKLLKEIGFNTSFVNGDEYTTRVYYFNCNKVVFSKGIFFYRQDNPEAITKKGYNFTDWLKVDLLLLIFCLKNNISIITILKHLKNFILVLLTGIWRKIF